MRWMNWRAISAGLYPADTIRGVWSEAPSARMLTPPAPAPALLPLRTSLTARSAYERAGARAEHKMPKSLQVGSGIEVKERGFNMSWTI